MLNITWFVNNFNTTSRVPWNQMTLHGYFYSAVVCLMCGPSFFVVNFSFLPFFMGIGVHYPQFRNFFRDIIADVNEHARSSHHSVKLNLVEAVKFHNDVKE